MFDRIAFRYDVLNRIMSFGIDVRWRRQLVRMIRKDAPEEILDIATGTGDLVIMMGRAMPQARLTGLDLSPEMLAIGRKRVARKNVPNVAAMIEGDAENLSFGDGTFDAVTVVYGVRNFGDIPQGLQEMYRVLKPGGKVYIQEFAMPEGKVFGALFHFYFRRLLPFIGGVISGEHQAYRYLQRSVEDFPYGDRFVALMEAAGFSSVSQTRMTQGLAITYRGEKG